MKLGTLGQRVTPSDLRLVQPAAKQPAAHYQTPEHAAWRKEVLRRGGAQCQRCGRSGTRLFADHITELRDGGAPLDARNGQALCGACHTQKTAAARQSRHRG